MISTGMITFLFTDIEGSTPLWEQHPEAMRAALARHDVLLRNICQKHQGHVFKTVGDAFCVAFASPIAALNAVLEAQRALDAEDWGLTPIKVRMGAHLGEAEARDNDYFGTTLNRVARLMSTGHGGQMLLSRELAETVRDQLPTQVTFRDLGQYRLKGLTQLEHLFQVVVPDLPTDFPRLASLDISPNNLPTQLTRFIGREKEVAEVKRALAGTHLVTLTGSGGCGKTRLAIQTASELQPDYPHGVWLVELAPLTDPALIVQGTAEALQVRTEGNQPLLTVLTDYLRAKTLLLVLDNCEHLIDASAQLADSLLKAYPKLRILASSREALGVAGEIPVRVPSLTMPDPQRPPPLDELARYEAVRLFVERASLAQPQFELTAQNASHVAQICHRLDGIPLALELAAARVKVLTVEQVAARLDDRFRLLTGGSRTALPRQQTLRALIDWSYSLLTEPERRLFRRLSVFASGWTLEAAETVCSGDGLEQADILDLLTKLVDKSLVLAEEGEDGVRYRRLETIRQYAREKLLESEEVTDVRQRHLDYFLRYAEQSAPHFWGPEMLLWGKRWNVEQDNFRTALEWALESQPEAALRLVSVLGTFWNTRGNMTEARVWGQRVLTQVERLPEAVGETGQARAIGRAQVLTMLAWAAMTQGDQHVGRDMAEAAIALARPIGETRALGRSLMTLGLTSSFLGQLDQALAAALESEAVCRQKGHKPELIMTLIALAQITGMRRGEPAQIQGYIEEAIALSREFGGPFASTMIEQSLARRAAQRGDLVEARERSERIIAFHREAGNRRMVNSLQSEFAHALRRHHQLEEASALYRTTLVEWQELGHRAAMARELECLAFIAGAQAQNERAAQLLGAAEALREVCGSPMTPMERGEYDSVVSNVRAALDEATFAQLWASGRAMTFEQAVAYALE